MPDPYGGDRVKVEKMRPKSPSIPFKSMSTMRDAFDMTVFSPTQMPRTRLFCLSFFIHLFHYS